MTDAAVDQLLLALVRLVERPHRLLQAIDLARLPVEDAAERVVQADRPTRLASPTASTRAERSEDESERPDSERDQNKEGERTVREGQTVPPRTTETAIYLRFSVKPPEYTMGPLVDERTLARLLGDVAAGTTPVADAVEALRALPYEAVTDARVDHHRELRTGHPEAIYGPGKTSEQVTDIAVALAGQATGAVLLTRATAEQADAVVAAIPSATFHERARLVVVKPARHAIEATVTVVAAGTSDLPVAEEAALSAEAAGIAVNRITDVGVAGVHRVLEHRDAFEEADCVIVVAGMEGALPSVVAGLTSTPIVAVPTSVGYGASFEGLAPLLTMLASCAPGVAVVNIDNGFGAALVAHRIVRSIINGSER
jgi:pyridinium-3,5-biscarboxylic acid mononucleotide synthase